MSGGGGKGGVLVNVQVLRAVAAFLVVLYHARLMTPVGQLVSFDFGNAGVDIFFYISGFIIAHVSRSGDVGHPGNFLVKRVIRIVPLYWLLTLALGLAAQKAPGLAGSGGRPDFAMLLKSLCFVPYFNAMGEMHPVLFMGWTLDYEMFFYLVFAVALLIREEVARLVATSAALVALVIAGGIVRPADAVAATYTDPMMLEFVIGLWMSRLYDRRPAAPLGREATVLLLVVAAAGFALLVAGDYLWPGAPRVVKWGGPALLIVAPVLALQHGGRTVGGPLLLLLGEASYAIYLVHPFVIKTATIAYQRLPVGALAVHGVALLLLCGVVAIVGVMLHVFVERPLIARLRAWAVPKSPPSIATAASAGT